MRILILGAGGTGGYFGARLHQAGGDVSFLVREQRARQLREQGLRVASPLGDVHFAPKVLTGDQLREPFNLVILSCKAYDLDAALQAIAPAAGEGGAVLPLLNGIAHLEALDARFGRERTLGGVAHLAVTLAATGEIKHLNSASRLIAGARGSNGSGPLLELARLFSSTSVGFTVSQDIEQEMWDKFVFLATLAAATCTMRSSVGDILDTDSGEAFLSGLLRECEQIAAACHRLPEPARFAAYRSQLLERGSAFAASMLRDMERGGPTEADHVIGDMVRRAKKAVIEAPLLDLAWAHLQAYEIRRRREPRA